MARSWGRTGLERLLHQGLAAQQRGDQAAAERFYLAVLALAPDEPNANHLLGALRFQQGRGSEALILIGKALTAAPKQRTSCPLRPCAAQSWPQRRSLGQPGQGAGFAAGTG